MAPHATNQSNNDVEMAARMTSSGDQQNKEEEFTTVDLGNKTGPQHDDAAARRKAVASAAAAKSKVMFAVGLQCFCSVSMVLTNKALAFTYNNLIEGDLNILLVVIQAVVAVVCVSFSKAMGWVEYPSFDMETARKWAPVNVLFCAMLFTGMASLQHNNVPMVTVFKNITNILISIGDYHCFGSHVEALVMASFAVMLGGAMLAAANDVEISTTGLLWMLANCFSTAGYVLYMKFATNTVKLPKFGMVFYNNVLCALFLFPVAFARGEVSLFFNTPAIHTWDYAATNVFAGFVGFFLNFSSLNCVQVTGPTTYAIVGSVNKIPITILGSFLFASTISGQTWFFIGISMMGGFLYSFAKIRSSMEKKPASEPQAKDVEPLITSGKTVEKR